MSDAVIRVALLEAAGVEHGFGTRHCQPPPVLRPEQVHGCRVVQVDATRGALGEADAVVSARPGVAVGVVTADCVPVLVCTASGDRVAAIHAGWRGLAAGVVEAAISALRAQGAELPGLRAAVGPRIGPCCYEVDAPVTGALRARYASGLAPFVSPSRPGHEQLDLGRLARFALLGSGVAEGHVALLDDACTHCQPDRFHSHRRDGARAGRMLHWIAARA